MENIAEKFLGKILEIVSEWFLEISKKKIWMKLRIFGNFFVKLLVLENKAGIF